MAEIARDNTEDKPLDPAVERVRAKLVRFMIVNLGILFIALMAVVIAIVYRKANTPQMPVAAPSELPMPAAGDMVHQQVQLPAGARVTGHMLAGDRISLDLILADGSQAILIYDLTAGRVIARLDIRPSP